MAQRLCVLLALAAVVGLCSADIYMHNMRGSNNRLDTGNVNVGNERRLFDSQNNAKGGYNHGYMYYYAGSKLTLEWTNQHGAGANPNVRSEIIIQYMCDDIAPGIRDGTREETITLDRVDDYTLGRHETGLSYAKCNVRERNKGLYTADQNLRNDVGALATRQNPGATRFGFECTEERDYYPYWHPTEWKDLAILTSNISRCDYYRQESQNVKNKGHCELTKDQQKRYDDAVKAGTTNFTGTGITVPPQAWVFNIPTACSAGGFLWKEDSAFKIDAPYCGPVPTTRDNHLGNAKSQGTGRGAYASMFNITIPSAGKDVHRCVLRMRYNISTGDFDGWNTFADSNRKIFPSQDNPTVTIFEGSFPVSLQLQVNTQQYFRTFEDRSHVWELYPNNGECGGGRIYNLNVRGKRGNIVETYPSVEYDFVPERLHVKPTDCVHLQWTGSNNNAANQAGEGVDRSDRSNFMQMLNHSSNYPANLSSITFIKHGRNGMTLLETLRYYALSSPPNNQAQLNDASPWFDGGLLRFAKGTYYYMSTRNNNFSNRSQKGVIISGGGSDGLNAAIIAAIVIFSIIVVAGAIIAWAVIGTRNPDSALGTSWASTRDFFTGFVDH